MAQTSDRIWHTTNTAGVYAERHPQTVRRACEAGELHGVQRKTKGPWRIHVECLDAWILGHPCPHKVKSP